MSKPPANASPPPKGKKSLVILVLVFALVAVGAGVAVPMYLLPKQHAEAGGKPSEAKFKPTGKRAYVPFGDVVVNLNEEKLHRFLRIKLLLVVDEGYEKQMIEQVTKIKPELKNWLIAYLSDKSLNDVSGAAGVNRLRREIWAKFNGEMFPDGSEHIQDVIFEEFIVQ